MSGFFNFCFEVSALCLCVAVCYSVTLRLLSMLVVFKGVLKVFEGGTAEQPLDL